MFILSKFVQNMVQSEMEVLSEMEVKTFVRIKKVIWGQLLASKAENIKGKLYFRLRVKI